MFKSTSAQVHSQVKESTHSRIINGETTKTAYEINQLTQIGASAPSHKETKTSSENADRTKLSPTGVKLAVATTTSKKVQQLFRQEAN